MPTHSLLQRQIKEATSADGSVNWPKLCELVEGAYGGFEQHRKRHERASSLMVSEMDALNSELADALVKVQRRTDWFEAAMANMAQGLCMYDSDRRLVVFNDKYATIYGLRPEQLHVGMRFVDILDLRRVACTYQDANVQSQIKDQWGADIAPERYTKMRMLGNGRVVEVHLQPMLGGGFLSTHLDITERMTAERRVFHLANHDGLTGLPNRAKVHAQLEMAMEKAQASGGLMAVLYIDLDGFKEVNDTLGHQVGDEVLKIIGTRFSEVCKEGCLLGRLAGDEFMIVFDGLDGPEKLQNIGQLICGAASRGIHVGQAHVALSASVGIAVGPTTDGQFETLIRNADLALYRVKAAGGNAFRFFEPQMDAEARERRQLAADLRHALPKQQLALHYQPQINLNSGEVDGYEALLRWDHPELGTIAPVRFIEIAEQTGQICEIGEWVLRTACTYAAQWDGSETIAVNISPLQLKQQDVVAVVKSALAESGLAPSRLELEITESVLIHNPDAVIEMIAKLNKMGVSLALDDFGTGFSSLSYLAKFAFQKIKIDKSFIGELGRKPEITAIVSSIIGLGRALGTAITAEGIEETYQHTLLRAAGCHQGQGYLYGQPLPQVGVESEFLKRMG